MRTEHGVTYWSAEEVDEYLRAESEEIAAYYAEIERQHQEHKRAVRAETAEMIRRANGRTRALLEGGA